jgi:hypothetical protein
LFSRFFFGRLRFRLDLFDGSSLSRRLLSRFLLESNL